jgi:membrane protease YdiL (CAAX protease family)
MTASTSGGGPWALTAIKDGSNSAGQAPIRSATDWARFILGFAILLGVLLGTSAFDATGRWGLAILAAVMLAGVAVERLVYRIPPREALRWLGFGKTGGRALLAACVVGALVQLVYPLTASITGTTLELRPGWPWLLIGIFAFHGLAEELVWRGYAYRRLRVGRSFRSAVLWTMPLVAVAHVPIVINSGPVVGVAALIVAAVTAVPLAYLFDTGRGTLWAPAVVHTAIDSFKLVIVPAAAVTTFSLLLAAVSIVVPLLVLAIPRGVLQPTSRSGQRD